MNKAVFACAGSRKTSSVVEEALNAYNNGKRVLILTYTITNSHELKERIYTKIGFSPKRIKIKTWLSFLMSDCVRPYQNVLYKNGRIEGVTFVQGKSAPFTKKDKIYGHFVVGNHLLYSDKIAKFAVKCNEKSDGLVIKRLEQLWDQIFIDEVQDLAAYDLDIIAYLFKSSIHTVVVGDVRQVVYTTHHADRLKQFRKENAIKFYELAEKKGLCKVLEKNECFRSIQSICDFADCLYPNLKKTISKYEGKTNHKGIFTVNTNKVHEYCKKYKPIILRNNKRTNTLGLGGMNFGKCKGQTYDRVLIFPTKPIRDYLKSGDIKYINDKHKFYVAITRARESIAFVSNYKSEIAGINEY